MKYRESKIIELERQVAALRDQCAVLESEVCSLGFFRKITIKRPSIIAATEGKWR